MAPPARLQKRPAILCFSHLRWEFVWQRPQHLLSRAAREYDVLFLEEPVRGDCPTPALKRAAASPGVTVLQLHVPANMPEPEIEALMRAAAEGAIIGRDRVIFWFYTPMALPLAKSLPAEFTVYDCMDDLASFKGAPPQMREREQELMGSVNLVLTGGRSLFEARRYRHPNVRLFPSSVEVAHF